MPWEDRVQLRNSIDGEFKEVFSLHMCWEMLNCAKQARESTIAPKFCLNTTCAICAVTERKITDIIEKKSDCFFYIPRKD